MEVNRPLSGWQIAITRPREQSDGVVRQIAALGGTALLYPLLEITSRHDQTDFLEALTTRHDLVVFTSVNGVRAFVAGMAEVGGQVPDNLPAYCVGEATAKAARLAGIAVQATPEVFAAEGLPGVMGKAVGARALLVRGNLAAPDLPVQLTHSGYAVQEAIGYETRATAEADRLFADAQKGMADVLAFFSGSAVKVLLSGRSERLRKEIALAAVGPKTAKVIADFGYPVTVVANAASAAGLVAALADYAGTHPKDYENNENGGY